MDLLIKKYGEVQSLKKLHFELGRTKLTQGEYLEARDEFYKAESLDASEEARPTKWEIQYFIGLCQSKIQGQEAEGIKSILSGSLLKNSDKTLLINEAISLLDAKSIKSLMGWIQNKWESQMPQLEKIDAKIAFHSFLSQFYFLVNKLNQSQAHAQKVLEIIPEHEIAKEIVQQAQTLQSLTLIVDLIEQENYSKAQKEIEQINPYINLLEHKHQLQLELLGLQVAYHQTDWKKQDNKQQSLIEKINLFKDKISIENRHSDYLHLNVETHILIAQVYIGQHHYGFAEKEVLKGLGLSSLNTDLLFLKAQVLIEGQIDLEEGLRLLRLLKKRIKRWNQKVQQIIHNREEDGNAHLFLAYIYLVFDIEKEKIENTIKRLDELSLDVNQDLEQEEQKEKYIDIGLFGVKALKAEKFNEHIAAASAFFQTARRYSWEKKYAKALEYFEKVEEEYLKKAKIDYAQVVEKDQEFSKYYWTYSSTLRLASYIDNPPYQQKNLLEKARDIWNLSADIAITSQDTWTLSNKAVIHENLYSFTQENAKAEYWKAIYYLERSIIYNPSDEWTWITLGNYYKSIDLYMSALSIINRFEYKVSNSNKEYLKDVQTSLLLDMWADSLNKEKVEENITFLLENNENAYMQSRYLGWRGFFAFSNRDYESAINYFEESIEVNPDKQGVGWHKYMIMSAFWRVLKIVEAKDIAREIIKLFSDPQKYPGVFYQFILGEAHNTLGLLDEACNLFEDAFKRLGDNDDPSSELPLIYLRKGKLDQAQEKFDLYVSNCLSIRGYKGLLAELRVLEKLDLLKNQESLGLLLEWKEKIHSIIAQGIKPLSAKEELNQELPKYPIGSEAWQGVQLGLARLALETNQYKEALAHYDLIRQASKFRDYQQAVNNIQTQIIQENRKLFEEGSLNMVVQDLDVIKNNEVKRLDLEGNSQYVVAKLMLGNYQSALEAFVETVTHISTIEIDSPETYGGFFYQEIKPYLKTPELQWKLEELVKDSALKLDIESSMAVLTNFEEPLKQDIRDLLVPKASFRSQLFGFDIRPISIEHHFPQTYPSYHELRQEADGYFKEIKDYFWDRLGIVLPPILSIDNPQHIPEGYFDIRINEVLILRAKIHEAYLFIPSTQVKDKLEELNLPFHFDTNPVLFKKGLWCHQGHQAILDDNKIEYLANPFVYIYRSFMDIAFLKCDQLHRIYDTHQYLESSTYPKAATILSDPRSLLIFHQLLKALLREQIPIIDAEMIIDHFLNVHEQLGLQQIIQTTRVGLKERINELISSREMVFLPEELEIQIREMQIKQDGQTFISMSKEQYNQSFRASLNF